MKLGYAEGEKTEITKAQLRLEIEQWVQKIGVRPKQIQIQRMSKKWASCSASGRICFSTDLLREDAAFRGVVIAHELLHLSIPNHGRLFRGLMDAHLPSWSSVAGNRIGRRCGQPNP